ncbi:Ig-like domain-containing protein, partial [Neobacillus drentensis]|uniref:Ig-like domain-containing protein n=1 Tax=Neobacillus drentensis TaxID=220684 RepID=UPI002FFF1704
MGFRKIISLVLVLFLSIQQLVFAAGTTNDVTSQNMIDNYLIISSSETWGQSKTVSQNVIVAPNATLTIGYGVDIQFQGNLIIYGKVQNNGRIYMNKHDVIANYVNMGGIKMWGDTNFPNNGIFDPYGSTTDVGCLCTPYKDSYPYPVPPVEITSPMNLLTVSKSSLQVEGRTVPGFKVEINGQQTTANQDGTFSLEVDLVLGENSLPVVITDTFTRVHHVEDLLVTYVNDEEAPVAPTVDPFNDTLSVMTGSGESGATITVKNAVGTVGETKVGIDGRFSVEIGKQAIGEILSVTATDEAGNVSEPTQVIVQDKTGPTIQSFSPADQAVKAPIDTSIRMNFNEDIQAGANFNKIEVLKSTGESVEVEKVISGKNLEIKPLAKLNYSTTYTVKIPAGGIKDSAGNENKEAFEFSFQTEEFSTKFSGGIYEDTTWTKDKSPYLVTGDVVVFPDTTLTIEPGVTVKFMSDTGMAIRGKLKSEGTESEKITFTSENQSIYWDGIQVDSQLGGTASFTQTNISHAHNGVSVIPDYTNQAISVTVDSSTFEGNQTGITSSYPVISINHSTFKNNTTGVNGSFHKIVDSSFVANEYGASINLDGYVYHSDFTNNHYGITGMANVYKSTFTGNGTALSLSNGNLRFNRIEDNQIGLEMTGSFTVSSNEFIHNQTGIDLFGTSSETIKSNTLNNQMWNVKNHTKFTKDLSQNYWGTTDEAVIKEKIYDGYDNVNNGLVTYKPFLTETVTLVDQKAPVWTDGTTYANSSFIEENGSKKIRTYWGGTATDDMAVKNYNVYVDGTLVGTAPGTWSSGLYDFEFAKYPPGDYSFKVEAVDFEGNISSNGPSATITIPDIEDPVWPAGSEIHVVKKDATSVTLEWTPAIDNVKVQEYILTVNKNSNHIIPGDQTSYTITNLKPWETYFIQVHASDELWNMAYGGGSVDDPSVSVKLDDHNPPKWPDDAVVTASNQTETSVHLDWPDASDEEVVDHYEIYMNGEYVTSSVESSYDVSGLSSNTEYTFSVKAKDRTGGNVSQPLSLTWKTPDYSAPYWDTGSTLILSDISDTSVKLSWPAAKDRGGITHYRIKQNGQVIQTMGADVTSYLVTGLSINTDYYFTVEAQDTSGNWSEGGLQQSLLIKDTKAPMWSVVDVLAADQITETDVHLSWQAAEDNVGVTNYRIKQNGTIIGFVDAMTTNYWVSGLTGNTEYEFTVEAGDLAGNWSNTGLAKVVKTKDLTAPAAPIVYEVTDQSTEVKGTAEPGSFIRVLANGMEIGTTTTNVDGTFTVSIPKQHSTVTIEVSATDASGNSSYVAMTSVQDVTPPAKPVVKEVTNRDTSVTGQTEPWVMVQINAGTVNCTATADGNGKFLVSIPVQKAGTQLVVTVMDVAGNVSEKATVVVVDVSSEKPTVEEVTDQDTAVLGAAEAGASIVVKANGELIGEGSVGEDGRFSVGVPVQKVGTKLEVIAIDQAGNVSDVTTVVVKDGTPPSKPRVNEVDDKHAAVTGEAEVGAQIVVKVNGTIIGRDVVGEDGKFRLVFALLEAGTKLIITCVDEAGNVSEEAEVVVKDITAPLNPWVGEVTDVDTTVFGEAEAGAKVQVKVNGTVIGEGSVGSDRKFAVKLSGAQKADTQLTITAIDAAGNESGPATIVVKDVTVPAKPVVNEVTDKELSVSGQAEA